MFFKVPTNPNIREVPDFSTRPGIAGYEMKILSTTQFSLQPGCARDVAAGGAFGTSFISYPGEIANLPGVITVDVSTVFALGNAVGGCFPLPLSQAGLATNNTVMPVFVLGDSSGKNATVAIVVTGSAFLPAGYDQFCRVGQVYVNGTTFLLIPALQSGHYESRNYILADAVRVLTNGSATAPALVDLTAGNGPVAPGTAKALLLVEFQAAVQTDSLMLIPTGLTSASVPPVQFENSVIAVNQLSNVEMVVGIDAATGHAGINYWATAGGDVTSIWVSGWTDDMAVQIN